MKKIILNIFLLLALGVVANAQQKGVGVETKGAVRDGAILDFPTNAEKGILLPRVADKSTAGTASGTFVYDQASKKVLFYGDNKWEELTTDANESALDGDLNPNGKKDSAEGVVIEDGTSAENNAPEGVLTLESNERALALPAVDNVANLPSPKAGLICYDKASKSLAIFNGQKWYFWR